ncbi:MAG: polysaccharide deacetylase family protein [Burkholderiaceae bacterium]
MAVATVSALALGGCVSAPPPVDRAPAAAPTDPLLASSKDFVVYAPVAGDTTASLARRFLGSAERAWEIEDFNGLVTLEPGRPIAIPKTPRNPKGVTIDGYLTVPVLTYHRIGNGGGRMTVSPAALDAQLTYLQKNGFRVVRLSDLQAFIEGTRQLPKKAVVISFDDGHISSYQYAFPILKKHGLPATYFLYTDFIGSSEGLSWAQIREMEASGLIDMQSHSKTHSNLVLMLPGESEAKYRERIDVEVRRPRDLIQSQLSDQIIYFAYPYGDVNEIVLERLSQSGHRLGLTVNPGGNPFFGQPFVLRRTMVFGEHNIEQFKALLQVFKEVNLR